ncbi:MAG: phosphate ABC transporter permease subunit PstC [Chloroflexi bacterium]|nr:MAG: phosphate ABC transporter permease subunit PstC [Chloroflexota bacterium]
MSPASAGGIAAIERHPLPIALRGERRRLGDSVFGAAVALTGGVVLLVLAAMVVFLVLQGLPAMRHYGFFSSITSQRWAPSEASATLSTPNPYGIVQFIYGTVLTSLIGMVIAVPLAVGAALVITDVAPRRLRRPLSSLVDLLAAVPSVVYGFWGLFALIPAIRPVVDFITSTLGTVPVIGVPFGGPFFGVSYFTAGLVLAIMILPIIAAVCREVFRSTPRNEKEAAVALGATRWEMIRIAVLPRARSGIVGASLIGLGRAVGETIAVTMVIGNAVLHINPSIFDQGATMSSVIANEFTEATEPFHLESLFVVGFWLLIVALVVNMLARVVVRRGVSL